MQSSPDTGTRPSSARALSRRVPKLPARCPPMRGSGPPPRRVSASRVEVHSDIVGPGAPTHARVGRAANYLQLVAQTEGTIRFAGGHTSLKGSAARSVAGGQHSAKSLGHHRARTESERSSLPDDLDRALHSELGVLAAVLGAQDAGEDVDAWRLVDQLLLDSARRQRAGELREADPELRGLLVLGGPQQDRSAAWRRWRS